MEKKWAKEKPPKQDYLLVILFVAANPASALFSGQETEYGFPISRHTGILEGVLFVNGTTRSDTETNLHIFDYIRPDGSIGLRIMMDKVSSTLLEVNGAGASKTKSVYLRAQKTFGH